LALIRSASYHNFRVNDGNDKKVYWTNNVHVDVILNVTKGWAFVAITDTIAFIHVCRKQDNKWQASRTGANLF
jgi:hypothetical protein